MKSIEATRLIPHPGSTTRVLGVLATTLFFVGCSVAPTIRDADVAAADTHIVFGSVEVLGAKGKVQDWGAGWTGHNAFHLTILPSHSNEAFTYKLDDDGMFYWALEPGDYTLLGYHWNKKGTVRTGRFGAEFSVPETGADTYIGSIVLQNVRFGLASAIEDRFDTVTPLYDAKFPNRKGSSIKQVVAMPGMLGNFESYRNECHEDWGVECGDRFKGVTPLSPECKTTGFPTTPGLQPTFRWQKSSRDDVSYDLVLYEAAAYTISGMMMNTYMKGHQLAYVEDLREPLWTPPTPLSPDTRYFWSVRLREGDTVSGWSTQSHFTFALVAWSSGHGQWFQFKTS